MDLELYTTTMSPYGKKVELHLEMKGIEFKRTFPERDFVRTGGYGEINPIRKIPTLLVDGIPLPEGEVICEFIEDMWPEPALRPADAMDRARMRLLSRIADLYVMSPIIQMLNNSLDKRSEDIAGNARGTIERGLSWLEHWIAPGPYALGEKRSMADCALPPVLFMLESIFPHFGLGALPNVGSKTACYFDAVWKDEDVNRCLAQMEEGIRERFGQASQSG